MSMAATGTDDMNLAPENDRDDDNQDNVDLYANDDGTGDATAQANVPTAPGGGGNGPTNFNLRVEQNKIPEFFGAKSKDTISAADFIRWLEDLAKTNRWTDAQTYHHFANSLRNPAREWLSSIVDWNTDENVRLVWSDFKDPFKQEYAVQTNDKLILEGLSNLAMKSNETTNELLTRITRTTRVIRESFDKYDAKILYPHNDINGGISNHAFRRFLRQYWNNIQATSDDEI
jgi:Ty3 transposon capsid-like protein